VVETSEHATNTILTGPILSVARLVWLVVTLTVIGLQIIGLPTYYRRISTPCLLAAEICEEDNLFTPAEAEELTGAGLSLSQFMAIIVVLEALLLSIWIGTGVVIFVLRSNDWMALLVSLTLIIFSSATFISGAFEAAAIAVPGLRWLVLALTLLGDGLITAFFLLFPNGRLVPRWLWWLIPVRLAIALLEYFPFYQALPVVTSIFIFLAPLFLMLSAPIIRYRRVSTLRERYQTRWVVFGTVCGLGLFLVFSVVAAITGLWQSVWATIIWALVNAVVTLIPISIGVAMLRSNLWDIDVVIRRTTIYAVLTALLALVYFGSVVVLQQVLSPFTGESTPVVVLSTLLIAALFLPLRSRVQDVIDRRFFRRKYDAEKVLERFAAAVRDETDLDELTAELVSVIHETVQPEHVSVWLRPGVGSQER